jgi:signal transduction histidine kinase
MTFLNSTFSLKENALTDGPEELLLELEYQRIARLERIVAHQQEQLRQHQALLKEYLHINSHNVRGPLVQIMGLVNLLQDEKGDNAYLLTCLKEASKNLDEAVHQVNDILTRERKENLNP